jgi:hypothetical protein
MLPSTFVDERLMRGMSTYREWRDHLRYERALIVEMVVSADPASVVYACLDELPRVTTEVAQRVRSRQAKYGPLPGLFADPERRHLAELSACSRRLSYVLERRQTSEYEQRVKCIESAIKIENEQAAAREKARTETNFAKKLRGHTHFEEEIILKNAELGNIAISFSIDSGKSSWQISSLVAVERMGVNRFGLHRLLPGSFAVYMNPTDHVRLSVALFAWDLAIGLLRVNWSARSTGRT